MCAEGAIILTVCTCELSADIQGHREICDPDSADTLYEDRAHTHTILEQLRVQLIRWLTHDCGGFPRVELLHPLQSKKL